MKFNQHIASICLLTLAAGAHAQSSSIERLGLYVAVSDLKSSSAFYEKLFQKKPYVTNDRIVAFDVAGGSYVLFIEQAFDRKLVRGNNVAPYIRVKNVDEEFARVQALEARMLDKQVLSEGPIKLFRFEDPDKNVVEFYSVVTADK